MKILIAALLLTACATVAPADMSPDYNHPGPCPSQMTPEQKASGTVQCRAECASWGRNIIEFDDQCRCVCTKPVKPGSNYLPELKRPTPGQVPNGNQT